MRGEGHSRARSCSGRRDHPRMRGEDRDVWESTAMDLGSPPHARGRLERQSVYGAMERITPACAGKTRREVGTMGKNSDHPRMRGEDWLDLASPAHVSGSPPHARGRLARPGQPRARLGITPACAGKTNPLTGGFWSSSDHPRMRGEDRVTRPRPGRSGGITPACAGKT